MNRFLLMEAIRQSNLHPTTKSFLSAVLKDATNANPENGGDGFDEDIDAVKKLEGGKEAVDEATRQALEQRKAEKAQRQMLGAVDVVRENERLGANLDAAAAAEAERGKKIAAAGPRGRVRAPKLLESAVEAVAPAQTSAQPARPTTMKELDAMLTKMAGGGTPPKGARERMAKLFGIELF